MLKSMFSFDRRALALSAIIVTLVFANGLASAQSVPGKAVSCGCYCGINIAPPCSDEACKRACGWKDPSKGQSQGQGSIPSPAGTAIGIMQQYNAERQRQDQQTLQTNQEMLQSLDAMSRDRIQSEEQMLRSKKERDRLTEERNRTEALSSMKGTSPTGELAPKPVTDASSPNLPLKPVGTVLSKPKLSAYCGKDQPPCPGNLTGFTFFCGGSTGCPYVCCPRGAPYLNHCDCKCYSSSDFDCGSYSYCKEQ